MIDRVTFQGCVRVLMDYMTTAGTMDPMEKNAKRKGEYNEDGLDRSVVPASYHPMCTTSCIFLCPNPLFIIFSSSHVWSVCQVLSQIHLFHLSYE
jgi:hypothetical protein